MNIESFLCFCLCSFFLAHAHFKLGSVGLIYTWISPFLLRHWQICVQFTVVHLTIQTDILSFKRKFPNAGIKYTFYVAVYAGQHQRWSTVHSLHFKGVSSGLSAWLSCLLLKCLLFFFNVESIALFICVIFRLPLSGPAIAGTWQSWPCSILCVSCIRNWHEQPREHFWWIAITAGSSTVLPQKLWQGELYRLLCERKSQTL